MTNAQFKALYERAVEAGQKAGIAASPVPMVVGSPTTPLGNDLDPNKQQYFVADGVCGFAWVQIKGNTAFARWAKKNTKFDKGYPSGLSYWVSEFNQSMQRKEAFARAMSRVLKEGGVEAYPMSRMD